MSCGQREAEVECVIKSLIALDGWMESWCFLSGEKEGSEHEAHLCRTLVATKKQGSMQELRAALIFI